MKGNWNRGTRTKRFHYQKRCTFKGTYRKRKPVCLQTFLFKTNPLRNTKKHSNKISTSLTCLPCFGSAMCCFWNFYIFFSPQNATLGPPQQRGLVSSMSRPCWAYAGTSAEVFLAQKLGRGLCLWTRASRGGPHHLVHRHSVPLPFLSRATKKRCRCPVSPLERDLGKLKQIIKMRIFSLEEDPCSETCVTGRNVAEVWDQTAE